MTVLPAALLQLLENRLARVADAFAAQNLQSEWQSWLQADHGHVQQWLLASDFACEVLCRFPQVLWRMYTQGELAAPQPRPFFRQQLAVLLTGLDDNRWMQQMRQYRNQQMARWIYRDANNLCSLEALTDELSAFAEAAIDAAITQAETPLQARFGQPLGEDSLWPQPLVVLGMGKLGAGELNLSSDIDLIFSYPEAGESNGRMHISNQEYFIKLGQAIIRLLDQQTADGFVFRIDMRLRPWGDGSALALSFAAMERYYEQHGREWERYAFIKARTVAGEINAGEELLTTLRPFVYRRYIDYSAFAALRDMKEMIEREVRRKDMHANIKLGSGGIRDVEFIAQAFQLIRGGVHKSLQQRALLPVLQELVTLGLLPAPAAEALAAAYRFLRQVEHRIQALRDQQTQMLPVDDTDRLRLACSLGFADWDSFVVVLDQHRAQVQAQFQQVVVARGEDGKGLQSSEAARQLWLDACETPAAVAALGFQEAEASARLLHDLHHSRALKTLPHLSRERIDQFMPLLLDETVRHEQPDLALRRCLPLVESVLRRTAYLVMLLENPGGVQRLVRLCAASPWIAEELTRYPVLLDELLNADTLFAPPQKEQLLAELRQQLLRIPHDDIEEQMRVLRIFKKSHVLRVAASDVQGTLPLMKVSDYLTWIAEAVLSSVLALAWQTVTARHGVPCRVDGTPCTGDFIIVAYGKLGGIELGYGSDLDLVFVHDADNQADTLGAKPISGSEFYAKLAQKINSLITTTTSAGQLYEVDMRLRPSGSSGLLVSSLQAFADYQHKHAWTWEHQALVRARVVAGDERLASAFDDLRRQVLARARDLPALRAEVVAMRQKMREHLSSTAKGSSTTVFDLKQDAGGIVDIEFMVQYGVLAWTSLYPELARYSDNVRILDGFAAHGLLSEATAAQMKAAYLEYRTRSHRLALAQQPAQVPVTEFVATRALVQQCWQEWFS